GMVPAALMGVPIQSMLGRAQTMASACRVAVAEENPGLSLGALMAASFLDGRDKMMLLLPAPLSSFGLWVEQLVAESTGKQGKGIVPIAGEASSRAGGADRFAVVVTFANESANPAVVARLRDTGTPFTIINVPDTAALGGEFLRW